MYDKGALPIQTKCVDKNNLRHDFAYTRLHFFCVSKYFYLHILPTQKYVGKAQIFYINNIKGLEEFKDTKKEIGENKGFEFGKGKVEIGINKILYIRVFQRNNRPNG